VTSPRIHPLAATGGSAEVRGTRTGPATYQVTTVQISAPNSTAAGSSGSGGVSPDLGQDRQPPRPVIQSWTGSPPPVGQDFDVTGTVTIVGSDTLTITLDPGPVSGIVTVASACDPPLARAGASAQLRGTRTGPDAYVMAHMQIRLSPASTTAP